MRAQERNSATRKESNPNGKVTCEDMPKGQLGSCAKDARRAGSRGRSASERPGWPAERGAAVGSRFAGSCDSKGLLDTFCAPPDEGESQGGCEERLARGSGRLGDKSQDMPAARMKVPGLMDSAQPSLRASAMDQAGSRPTITVLRLEEARPRRTREPTAKGHADSLWRA